MYGSRPAQLGAAAGDDDPGDGAAAGLRGDARRQDGVGRVGELGLVIVGRAAHLAQQFVHDRLHGAGQGDRLGVGVRAEQGASCPLAP